MSDQIPYSTYGEIRWIKNTFNEFLFLWENSPNFQSIITRSGCYELATGWKGEIKYSFSMSLDYRDFLQAWKASDHYCIILEAMCTYKFICVNAELYSTDLRSSSHMINVLWNHRIPNLNCFIFVATTTY